MSFPLNVTIASGVRTAVGRAVKGTLRNTRPDDMAAAVTEEARRRVDGLKAEDIDDVILGCAFPEGEQGMNVARVAVFLNRWPNTIPAETINRFCSSGLQAIVHGAQAIQVGMSEAVVVGGVESMSMVPMGGNKISLNPLLSDGYPEAYIGMGHTAERVAKRFNITREEQDALAVGSHDKALAAIAAGRFKDEILPITARGFDKGELRGEWFDTDECPRAGTTLDVLGKLKPAFAAGGTVTAGNSSPVNDGAAALTLLSEKKASALAAKGLGKLRAYVVVGVEPDIMGIGPLPAITKLLETTGLSLGDIDLFEINEAFAAQAAYVARELGIPDDKINVNGGAIALGHPLGCTGAKLAVTLLHELKRRNGRYGVVSMCIGGGMGAAALFEA